LDTRLVDTKGIYMYGNDFDQREVIYFEVTQGLELQHLNPKKVKLKMVNVLEQAANMLLCGL
jgi:hypothetical protein